MRTTDDTVEQYREMCRYLRMIRQEQKIPQKHLAQDLDVHVSSLLSWERFRCEPHAGNFQRWVARLDQRIAVLDNYGSEWKFAGESENVDIPADWDELRRVAVTLYSVRSSIRLKQHVVATRMGVSQPLLSRLEQGILLARPRRLCTWAESLNCSIGLVPSTP